jgi:hypothetical protein
MFPKKKKKKKIEVTKLYIFFLRVLKIEN